MKNAIQLFKSDKRYLVLTLITVFSFGAAFLFPNAIPRLIKSIWDFLTSFAYYWCDMIFEGGKNPISPTIIQVDSWNIFPQVWDPVRLLPSSIAEFFEFWFKYFKCVVNVRYFLAYIEMLYNLLYYVPRIILIAMWPLIFTKIKLENVKKKHVTERNKKSSQLERFELFLFTKVKKAVNYIKDFVSFCGDFPELIISWIVVWCLYFNLFSILVSALGYYFYLISSWDVLSLYVQALKLQMDLTPILRFVPGIVWAILVFKLVDIWANNIAESRLQYAERCNKAFLRQRGISTIVYGESGSRKTLTTVGMTLTAQDNIFEDQSETMYQYDHYFPNFPWQNLRDELNFMIDKRLISEPQSTRKWFKRWSQQYDLIRKKYTFEEYQRYVSNKYVGFPDLTFKYNYDRYSTVYSNGIRFITLYQAIEEYACAYVVFTVNTSLIFSNISIRSDSVLNTMGNMPYRYSHLLEKDPHVKMINSKYAHIIDMDMMRRAKQLVKDNPKARTLLPGIYVDDEIDKERKNQNDLKDLKVSSDEANQKNDGYNIGLSTGRHSNLVNFKSTVYFLSTLQRPDALGAGTRQLGELLIIENAGEKHPVLPFFSPFWIFEPLYLFFEPRWKAFYKELEIYRCDQTLLVYLMKNIMAALSHYYERQNNLYGVQKLTVEIEDGLREGKVKTDYWIHITRKEFADVYVSDCLRAIYEPNVPNKMHVDDYECYSGIVATPEELAKQNSYFQNDIRKMKGCQ